MAAPKKSFSVIPQTPQEMLGTGFNNDLDHAFARLDQNNVATRLFQKDPSLWKAEKDIQAKIKDRLGWLTLPDDKQGIVKEMTAFAKEIKEEGYKYAVLLGMGGSSLCTEVTIDTFGAKRGYLKVLVLDDTDPEAIHAIEKQVVIEKTLFIAASKSGNTKETLSFFQYFYALAKDKMKDKAGHNFVAITDKGTPLVDIGKKYKFRRVFINPSDIGGRYSVLSDFGLLPMALAGVDISAVMSSALEMEDACKETLSESNPGIYLGAEIGVAQLEGKDKLTFILSPDIASFGYWVEQLVAESTGKEGKGLIPISGEEPGKPDVYGDDRTFVYIYTEGDQDKATEKKVNALDKSGHPVVRIGLPDKVGLGAEYYCWEVATAIAGMIIGINPFDEPNVAESKKNTENLLADWQTKKSFTEGTAMLKSNDISIYTGGKAADLRGEALSVAHFINEFQNLVKDGDYIALLPYFYKTESRTKVLQSWRQKMRDQLKVATTLLHGPRYLHSTGQLHKGGPDTGLYIIFTAGEKEQLPIPGEKYGFDVLHRAQALGDFRSLSDKGRRVIRIDLGEDVDAGLAELWKQLNQKEGAKK